MKTALVSVFHKAGIVEFARALVALGWNILASGGTARTLREADVPVTDVAKLVGEPILGHRVVTLSREVHAALLARDTAEDNAELARIGIERIDLVCVDLYPLEAEIEKEGSTSESVIEQTDIGGPTMLRSAAKGRRIVIADPNDRGRVLEWLRRGELDSNTFRDELAAKAEGIVARYCLASARYHSKGTIDGMIGTLVAECKPENGSQGPAGLYTFATEDPLGLDRFTIVAGGKPSSNNWTDVDRALQTLTHIAAAWESNFCEISLIAVGVKHGNPCGAAVGTNREEVLKKMIEGDPQALFGGAVITNFPIGREEAELLRTWCSGEKKRAFAVVAAPSVDEDARGVFKRRKGYCVLENPALATLSLDQGILRRPTRNGFLRQGNYTYLPDLRDPEMERIGLPLTAARKRDLILADAVCRTSNSNTITLAKDGMLIGNGTGQMDRRSAAALAIRNATEAGHDPRGACAVSDSFFAFTDALQALVEAGVRLIFATSGSDNDNVIREFALAGNITTLLLLPDAKARGFYRH